MGILDWFRRGAEDRPLKSGRVTAPAGEEAIPNAFTALTPYRSRHADVLTKLRQIPDAMDALDFLRRVNPDVSMAVWNFIRLANVGHDMEFYGVSPRNKGKRLTEVEALWRDEFASRVNALSNDGLDGLINQLHYSAYMRGGQGLEVEIAPSLDDIVDVYPVDPKTLEWQLEDRRGPDGRMRKVWVPYQRQGFNRVDLSEANFFWVPTDPDIDDPRGNLVMESVLQAVDFQMQMLQDLQQVIHNQGWSRWDIELVMERLLQNMPAKLRSDPKAQKEWLEQRRDEVIQMLRNLKPDDSFVHFDDVKFNPMTGGQATRSIDVRAIFEGIDTQLMSGAKQMSSVMNRTNSNTETWSTVQFRVFVQSIKSVQRGSKRLIEEVARLWLRVKGIQARPRFVHHTVDWQSEADRWRVELMKEQYFVIATLMGWLSNDEAAARVVGVERAYGEPSENIRATFGLLIGGDSYGHRDDPRRSVVPAPRPGEAEAAGRSRILWLPTERR